MKNEGKSLLVRAYELAATGRFSSNKALRSQLKIEGYSTHEIEVEFKGRAFRDKLAKLMGIKRPSVRKSNE